MIQNFPGTSFSDGYIKTVVVGRLRKVGDSFTDDTGLLVTWVSGWLRTGNFKGTASCRAQQHVPAVNT
jgi:hypothetical protein